MNDPKIKGWKFGICWNATLPPIIMEVENDPKWKETNIGGTHFHFHDYARKGKGDKDCGSFGSPSFIAA